jgi:hypothetical protein
MPNGIKALRRIQGGAEGTAGTKVPATWIWRGTGVGKDNRETTFVEEDIGLLGDANRTYVAKTGGEITMEAPASFEQLGYTYQSGLYVTTPTTDASSAKIWEWNSQITSTDPIATTDLQTYSMEFGDNAQCEYMTYVFTREYKLSGSVGAALMTSATMEGREVGTTDFTPTTDITLGTPETILFSNGSLFIDNVTSSTDIGQTQVSQTLFAGELNHVTGWKGYPAADGRTDFSFIKRVKDEITLSLTFEHNSSAAAEKSAWRNQTERCIRLMFVGSALSTTDATATYDKKTFIIDLWGKWESFDALTDNDGNDQVTGLFRAGYSILAGKKARFIVVSELAALP